MAEAEQKEVKKEEVVEVKKEEAVEVKKEVKKEEKKVAKTEREKTGVEQVFTIPLRKAKSVPRWKRSNKAIKVIKAYLARHLKAEENKIHIDASINEKIWSRGSQKPPIQIRVRAMKFEDGVVEAELIED
ncbi:MAG: 50S ribosomal protein L31e [Methanocellales archaeon]